MRKGMMIEFRLAVMVVTLIVTTSRAFDSSLLQLNGNHQGLRCEQEMRWLYDEWIIKHDKAYGDIEEKENRFKIFRDNLEFIDEHNRPQNNHTYTLGLNQFADLTDAEFQTLYLSSLADVSMQSFPPVGSRSKIRKGRQPPLPSSVDWKQMGAVSPAKDQGAVCESCRAFSVVCTLEGLHQIRTGDLITLSEQELIDCDKNNKGCKPGYTHTAFQYIIDNGGIDTDANYPYAGVDKTCKKNRKKVVKISGYKFVQKNNEFALLKAIAGQPVSIAINASSRGIRFLKAGVFTGPCNATVNHAVAAIGYGTDLNSGIDYWLVKNSWGTNWGVDGIGKIERDPTSGGRRGKCGILTYSVYPMM